jgi:PKD repeat protein
MKKQLLYFITVLLFFFKTGIVLSQQIMPIRNIGSNSAIEPCGFDAIHKDLLEKDPVYRQKTIDFDNYAATYAPSRSGTVYKIPCVVHVMSTNNALTEVTDDQIRQAIREMNEMLRKVPGTKGDGNGTDTEVEYALAVRDPNGNCTNGIVRVNMTGNSTYMNFGVRRQTSNGISDTDLKNISRWSPSNYYNIWLVSEIDNNEGGSGIQGYAFFASSHGTNSDGTVMLVNALKVPGNTTLTHEIGHSLNLFHTFEGDNSGTSCPLNSNCSSDGDRVCDTPPHIRSQSDCPTGTNSCTGGSVDLYKNNYLDYSSDNCQNMLTSGQKTRMHAAITGQRGSYLASNGNLSLIPPSTATVDFSSSRSALCGTGQSITFYDNSTCSPNTYLSSSSWSNITYSWTITNGTTIYTSTSQNPTITFNVTGTYNVTLEITNSHGTTSLTKNGMIFIGSAPIAACTPTSQNNGNFWQTIFNVKLGTINNTTSRFINAGYSNFSCSQNTLLTAGESYPLSISANAEGGNGNEVFEVYIDYNNNGSFADAGELVFSGMASSGTSGTFIQNIIIPSSAVKNTILRMRVIGETGTITSFERNCTASYFVGDVEDYGVIIQDASAATANFTANNTSPCVNTSITFTDASTGATSWSWNFGSGATPSTATGVGPHSVSYSTSGQKTVSLTINGSVIESKTNYITVNAAPAITTQPSNSAICAGSNTSFSVTATGASLTYQWQLSTNGGSTYSNVSNGGVYSNATTATLNITSATSGMSGYLYRCVVSGSCAPAATSNGATLTINAAPAITTQPSNSAICAGSNTSFSVTATGASLTYQWQLSTNGGSTYSNVSNGGVYSNATTATLNITSATSGMSGYLYRCVVSGSCAPAATSNGATLTINAAPAITTQPSNSAICAGSNTSFSVTATGASLTYQWQLSTNGGSTYSNVSNGGVYSNATTATLNITSATSGMSGYLYRCVVSGSCAPAATSNGATLTINAAPAITTQPSNSAICAGSNTSFSVTATGASLTYQWQLSTNGGSTYSNVSNGGVYSNATTATLNITSATSGMSGYLYRCVVSGSCAPAATSNGATLTINAAPAITTQPSNSAICAGSNTSFSVTATGFSLTYQWQLSTNGGSTYSNVSNGGVYSNATTATLNITSATSEMSGYLYRCVVSGSCTPAATSNGATLTVNTCATATANFSASSVTTCTGTSVTFTDASTGATSWSWNFGSGASPATATGVGPHNVSYSTGGSKTVSLAINGGESIESKADYITVNTAPTQPETISGETTVCSGSSNIYSIIAVAGATSYTWTLPSGWSGSSTSTSINATAGTSGGNVTVTANNSCGNSSSASLSVNVTNSPTQPGTISGETTVCLGSSNIYSITAVAGATSYTWTLPSGWSGSSTSTSINATAGTSGGNVTVTANNSCGNSSSASLSVNVTNSPTQPGTISGETTVCSGSSNIYSITAVAGATSYTWTLPSGWSGSSTSTSINATAGTSGGNVTVTANNSCK